MRNLVVTLADIEGVPHGSATSRTSVVVSARYTWDLVTTDGAVIPAAMKPKPLPTGGAVTFSVHPSQDPDVAEGWRGFGVVVEAIIRRTDGRGPDVRVSRTVVVPDGSGPVQLGALEPAEPLPPQYATVGEAAQEAADAIRDNLATDISTPGNPAYEALVDVAGTLSDPQTAGLIGDLDSETRAALDTLLESVAVDDADVAGLVAATDSSTRAALDTLLEGVEVDLTDYPTKGEVASDLEGKARREVYHADAYRASHATDLDALHAACADATAAGRGNLVHLSGRTWDVGAGLKMSGYSCGIIGTAAGHDGTNATGAVLWASAQDGPALDLDGLIAPNAMRGRLPFRNFAIRGSGASDAMGANSGIGNPSGAAFSSVVFSDIAISATGGPCIDVIKSYLSHYERLTLTMPVDAQANNIPWCVTRATRGNRFYSIGFRSLVIGGSVGTGGALVSTGHGDQVSGGDLWHGAWLEALHAPTDGTLIHIEGNGQAVVDTYFVDCGAEENSSNTSLVRFAPNQGGSNFPGGNIWRGAVPGRNSVATHTVSTGILVSENNTHIEGPKEQRDTNVTLAAGVTGVFVALGGQQSPLSGSPGPSVVDNSGNHSNTYLDYAAGKFKMRGYVLEQASGGFRVVDAANTANGRVYLGDAGVQVQSANGGLFFDGNSVSFRNGSTSISFNMGNRPGINLPDAGPSPLPSPTAGLRGRVLLVHGGAGMADQMYVCRKKADESYEWAPLT